eukprot:NODE_5333_length_289_cov_14.833333_g5250_i0.p5 GENE.NODE_5333_length_289_cov_14.833333_g5250_i0~~NODE_5333_length_289_cov_14.833333_g5250_i0.p5  ORF type:complete len:59 (-),score=13.00 NODE_5333_length_289_cov_14.833333_g5250_i0:80-256(-)
MGATRHHIRLKDSIDPLMDMYMQHDDDFASVDVGGSGFARKPPVRKPPAVRSSKVGFV